MTRVCRQADLGIRGSAPTNYHVVLGNLCYLRVLTPTLTGVLGELNEKVFSRGTSSW